MARWPVYERETVEDLDTHLDNFGQPVTDAYEVQVLPFGDGRPVEGGWQPQPYRIDGLPAGRYSAWTRWQTRTGAQVVDYVGEHGWPTFEVA